MISLSELLLSAPSSKLKSYIIQHSLYIIIANGNLDEEDVIMSIQKAGTLKTLSHYILIKDFLDPAILAGAPDEAKAEANSDEKGMCLTIISYIYYTLHCIIAFLQC